MTFAQEFHYIALLILGVLATFATVGLIFWLINSPRTGGVFRRLTNFSPQLVATIGLLFGLYMAFFANDIWSICNLLRGPYKRNEYRKVILPLTVLKRFDSILAPTKEKVLTSTWTVVLVSVFVGAYLWSVDWVLSKGFAYFFLKTR